MDATPTVGNLTWTRDRVPSATATHDSGAAGAAGRGRNVGRASSGNGETQFPQPRRQGQEGQTDNRRLIGRLDRREQGDAAAFAAALRTYLDDEARARATGAENRRDAVTRFSWAVSAARMREVYAQTIDEFHARRRAGELAS